MCKIVSKLTVFFEAPFWVGIYEREYRNRFEACKITFGAEPKDYEVYDFMLKNWGKLKFISSIQSNQIDKRYVNPKRMHRSIVKELQNTGIGTKAQKALQLQREQNKTDRKHFLQEAKSLKKERQFELRQEKRKSKHRGH